MATKSATISVPWYKTLNRKQWRVLVASNLAWVFDGFEFYGLFLTVGFALHQLLPVAEYKAIPAYAGYILATTVFGQRMASPVFFCPIGGLRAFHPDGDLGVARAAGKAPRAHNSPSARGV